MTVAQQSAGYKVGVGLLVVASIIYIIGFASPHWASAQVKMADYVKTYSEGLWMLCVERNYHQRNIVHDNCDHYGTANLPEWFHAARVFSCLCLIGLIGACIFTLSFIFCWVPMVNCCRCGETLTFFAASLGLIGCMLYLRMRDTAMSGTLESFDNDWDWSFDWAFYFVVIATCFAIVAAVIIACFNRPVQVDDIRDSEDIMDTRPPPSPRPVWTPRLTETPYDVGPRRAATPYGLEPRPSGSPYGVGPRHIDTPYAGTGGRPRYGFDDRDYY